MASLREIEERIKQLEAELNNDGVGASSPSSSDEEADPKEEAPPRKRKREPRNDEHEKIVVSNLDDPELGRIEPLPAQLLPPPGLGSKFSGGVLPPVKKEAEARAKKSSSDAPLSKNGEDDEDASSASSDAGASAASKPITCEPCRETLPDKASYKKHIKTTRHRQNVVLAAGAAYEPAEHTPNYCRACSMQFSSPEELLEHRSTTQHKEAKRELSRASYCTVCKKQFTSPVQLRGHLDGKAHRDELERRTGFRSSSKPGPQDARRPPNGKPSFASSAGGSGASKHFKSDRRR